MRMIFVVGTLNKIGIVIIRALVEHIEDRKYTTQLDVH